MTWKPGDKPAASDSMIRVDQAGEFGAIRIYAGQLAIMGQRSPMARKISAMAARGVGLVQSEISPGVAFLRDMQTAYDELGDAIDEALARDDAVAR